MLHKYFFPVCSLQFFKFIIYIFFFFSTVLSDFFFSPRAEFYAHLARFKNQSDSMPWDLWEFCSFQYVSELNWNPTQLRLLKDEGKGKRGGCTALPLPASYNKELHYTGQWACPRASYFPLVDACFPTACLMVKQALHILNHNTGCLPENVSFENGRLCPSTHRKEADVWKGLEMPFSNQADTRQSRIPRSYDPTRTMAELLFAYNAWHFLSSATIIFTARLR